LSAGRRALISARGGRKLRADVPASAAARSWPHVCIAAKAPAASFRGKFAMPLSAAEVLNREFLEIRCKILDLAAAFDRLGRAEGSLESDPRISRLREAIQIVLDEPEGRAEQVQMLFSRPYEDGWLDTLKVKPR
jgi:hypothetical protein